MRPASPALICLVLLCAWLVPIDAPAHPFAVSGLRVHIDAERIDVRLDLDVPTLVDVLDVGDAAGDPRILSANREVILAYVEDKLQIRNAGDPCRATTPHRFEPRAAARLLIEATYACAAPLERLEVENTLFMEDLGGHTHTGRFEVRGKVLAHVFRPSSTRFAFDVTAPARAPHSVEAATEPGADAPAAPARPFPAFLGQGVLHILIGLDHILFVLALVMVARGFRELALVITAFTAAHSVTLALGALQIVSLSEAFVESAIALSVLYVALENLFLEQPRWRYGVTFAFGLVHGFGFSSVLSELGLPEGDLWPALLAFNVGVEVGQLLLVAPVFPAVLWLRRARPARHRAAVRGSSVLIGALAVLWFLERALGLPVAVL